MIHRLRDGTLIEIDELDIDLVKDQDTWLNTANGYVYVKLNQTPIALHKLIAARKGLSGEIDHINSDRTNLLRGNLRATTHGANIHKSNKPPGVSGFKGVYIDPKSGKFVAKIKVNGIQMRLGTFTTAQEASERYQRAARKYYPST